MVSSEFVCNWVKEGSGNLGTGLAAEHGRDIRSPKNDGTIWFESLEIMGVRLSGS